MFRHDRVQTYVRGVNSIGCHSFIELHGADGSLPWKSLPGDMAYFKKLTSTTRSGSSSGKKNAVIMGRKTWESIPAKFRPLAGRINVVLSKASEVSDIQAGVSDESAMKDVIVSRSLEDAMDRLEGPEFCNVVETVFVIGGGQVYKAAMESPRLSAVHLTVVEGEIECDTFMVPVDETKYKLWAASSPRRDAPDGPRYSFLCYTRWPGGGDVGGEKGMTNEELVASLPPAVIPQHEEYQYLDMIDSVIREGVYRGDRTGTGTFSSFGRTMRFNLRHTFPLLTTKRVFWRGRNIQSLYLSSCSILSMIHYIHDLVVTCMQVWQKNCCGLSREAQMPRNCQTKEFTFGTGMDLVNTLIPLVLRRGKKATLGQFMAFNGATLGQSTLICMQAIRVKGLTSLQSLFTRSRQIRQIGDLFSPRGIH